MDIGWSVWPNPPDGLCAQGLYSTLLWERNKVTKPNWEKWLVVLVAAVFAVSCSGRRSPPTTGSNPSGRVETALPQTEGGVKTVDKTHAITAARGVLGGDYQPDPVQVVEKESSWELLFQVKGALSGTQVIVDKTTGKARVGGITR